jgi:hypothetical protein
LKCYTTEKEQRSAGTKDSYFVFFTKFCYGDKILGNGRIKPTAQIQEKIFLDIR